MPFKDKTAIVFGGTGFIGRQVVRELARLNYRVKVASRVPERAYFLRPCGVVGQIVPVQCNASDYESVASVIRGCDLVVNCIGVLFEKQKGDFKRAHVDIPGNISKACAALNAGRFVHISALGIDICESHYAQTKREGEKAIQENFQLATILRPSVVFGPEDKFFNMFAELARYLPAFPLIGGGKTRFQPVFVGDVADAVIAGLTLPDKVGKSPRGKTYELGGPEVIDFKGIYKKLFHYTCRKRLLVPVPWGIAKIQGAVLGVLPEPLLTVDQVRSLKHDVVVSSEALTFDDLGITAKDMDTVLPTYLERYCPGGHFHESRSSES